MAGRVVTVALVALALAGCSSDEAPRTQAELIRQGEERFESVCAACHGTNLRGTANGPSFLQEDYAPGNLPDDAFYDAVENGVTPTSGGRFGPMPPQPGFSEADVEAIIAYVRSRQREAGID